MFKTLCDIHYHYSFIISYHLAAKSVYRFYVIQSYQNDELLIDAFCVHNVCICVYVCV